MMKIKYQMLSPNRKNKGARDLRKLKRSSLKRTEMGNVKEGHCMTGLMKTIKIQIQTQRKV